jgi:hypothetical protein
MPTLGEQLLRASKLKSLNHLRRLGAGSAKIASVSRPDPGQIATILMEAGVTPEKRAEIYKKIVMKTAPVIPGVIPKESSHESEEPSVARGAIAGAGAGAGLQAAIVARELHKAGPVGRGLLKAFPSFGLSFAGGHAGQALKKGLIGAGIGAGVQALRGLSRRGVE